MTSEFFLYSKIQHIAQDCGLQACSVGVYKEKQGLVAYELAAELHKGPNALLYLPDLALGAPAVGGRIHDNSIVFVSPSYLALDKLFTVVNEPAYRSSLKA